MGLWDSLTDGLKNVLGQSGEQGLIAAVLAKTDLGSLKGIAEKLQEGGLGEQVKSWLGNGSNLPVTGEQIRGALGNEHVQQIARQLGLPVDAALKLMADHLPGAVDKASPKGKLDDDE
jgi:uncharacterized protein YidB (DUF937 family)